jgi:hypothetical protein
MEIKHPKQNMRDVLNFLYLDEIELRKFLVRLNGKLKSWIKAN